MRLSQRKNVLVDQFMAFWRNMTVDLSVNMVGISCSYWILATMLFFGECTLNFKHRSFRSFPVKRQVRLLQKISAVISGKKIQHPLMKAKGFEQKESRMFRLFWDWPSRTFKEAFTGFNPVLLEKNIHGLAGPWIGYLPNLPRLPLRLAVPPISLIDNS